MERVFIGLRPLGPATEVATGIYKSRGNNNANRIREGVLSLRKERAIRTANRFCTTCPNLASQIAMFDCDGATRLERYCQACIDASKHLADNELMANFDNLFIRADPRD